MAAKTPDYRGMGAARLDVAKAARTQADWKRLWKKPAHEWAIRWGTCWKACFEYRVNDFAAEVGMFVDVLGFPTNAFGPDYAMLTSPDRDFYFSIVKTKPGESATPPDSVHLQFMVEDLFGLAAEFQKRGVDFVKGPTSQDGSPIYCATFRTPNGIPVDLWGMVDPKTTIRRKVESPKREKLKVR